MSRAQPNENFFLLFLEKNSNNTTQDPVVSSDPDQTHPNLV